MDCKGCGDHGEVQKIPYIAYEAECARHERTVRRLVWIIVICIVLIFASNAAWLYAWNQYDYEVTDEAEGWQCETNKAQVNAPHPCSKLTFRAPRGNGSLTSGFSASATGAYSSGGCLMA